MGAGYERQSAAEISDGEVIEATDFNNEFAALLAAFAASTGHSHDGTTGEGGHLGNTLTIGTGADTDIVITFNANSNDGVLTWMEDEDYFKFSDDLLINSTEKIQFGDTATFIHQSSDGVMTIDGEATIDLNASTAVLVSNDLKLNSDSAVVGFGADNDVTLTHVADTGVLLNSSRKIQFGDSATFIHQSSDGVMRIEGEATIDLNASTEVLVSNNLSLDSDASVLGFGADNDVTLTHVADTGILLNSTMAIQFNDASQYINAPSNAILDINATDEIELNATLVDVNANMDVSGTYTGGGLMTTGGNIVIPDAGNIGSASDTNAISISSGGVVAVTATTANTSASDGALTVAGGLGVAADVSIGDDLRLISDSSILSFGADSDITITHAADTSLAVGGAGGTTGLIINNTATDGDPFLAFALSGTQTFTMGVDDGDSDKFKIGTTAIGTSTAFSMDSSGNVAITGDLTITGDDLFMGTNTSGAALIADGTNFNPVVISGDATIATNGALTIAANAVEGSMLNTDVISGQTALTSGLATTDELLVSDAGTLKRMDVSVLSEIYADVGLAIALG